MLNWSLKLSEYDYDIVHIPLKLNDIGDCLSRLQSVCVIADVQVLFYDSELSNEQNNDREISNAVKYLQQSKMNFDVNRLGSLKSFRKKLEINEKGVLVWNNKTVLPFTSRRKVLESCQDHPLSGHFASDRTCSGLCKNYFRPHAKNDVENWMHSCKTCNHYNTLSHGYVKRPLTPIETSQIFELVCYDLPVPFMPKSEKGMVYALIIIDHYSKCAGVVALPYGSAPTIAQAIYHNWIC